MRPVQFPESNVVIAENQEPYIPLPALACGDNMGTLLMCWELDAEELDVLTRTGKLWVTCLSFNQPLQPLHLSVDKPIIQ
jgi:hypothetical protein